MASPTRQIDAALQTVFALRQQRRDDARLLRALSGIKRFQAARFKLTYDDLLRHPRYQSAAAFFLHELYGDQDYGERDQQFSRIAGTIDKLFPQSVVSTAASLAETHALTETLDDAMARQWLADEAVHPASTDAGRYVRCWRAVGDAAGRQRQLAQVMQLGQSLSRLTRLPGLRTLLKMMRRPAAAAGLTDLQRFLETGFDAFTAMKGADEFLGVIAEREAAFIQALFEGDAVACETRLRDLSVASVPP